MATALLIKNALAIDPLRGIEMKTDLLASEGRIKAVAPGLKPDGPGTILFNASGLWLFPGLIDMHVHTREPGLEAAEDLASAAKAAAAGGITSILAMPNTDPPADKPELLRRLRAKAAGLPANVFFSAAVTAGRAGRRLAAFGPLKKAGASAFTDDGSCIPTALLRRALSQAGRLGAPVLDHAEAFGLTGEGVMHDCPLAHRFGLPVIPEAAETYIVLRDVLAARAASAPLHLQHLSCRESVELTAAAKKAGAPVTAETCPHYFTLTCGDVRNPDFKMKPPLRGTEDRAAVRRGLASGAIDVIASDHAPHTAASKRKGMLAAPFGVIGLETMLGLSLTELVHTRLISRLRLAELLSANPARILGLKGKGGLAPGMDADLTLVDPRAVYRVKADFASRSSNSPFIGRRLRGRAAATITGGRLVFIGRQERGRVRTGA